MGDNGGENIATENRSHALALMRFFSVDVGSEMNIPTTNTSIQVPEFTDLWSKEILFKIVQLVTGFICVTTYSEGQKILSEASSSRMFPNIVISSFIIITSVIIFSYMLGCMMPEVQTRIFDVLGTILYFASATVTTYECAVTNIDIENAEVVMQKKFLLATAIISYFNSIMYGLDMYYSIKKAVGCEIKLEEV